MTALFRRVLTVAHWMGPAAACLALYWPAWNAWFYADDFAWLKLGAQVSDWSSFVAATFSPKAQGTIRPWSERLFFMGLHAAFGLNPVPFRVCVFLTQTANLLLISSITRRLTGSAAAGLWAALLWISNSSLALALGWTSIYNQVLCAAFLLLAFHFLLRFAETGRSKYEAAQWAVFLAGFGALETNAAYPALAVAYAVLCARKLIGRVLPLLIPSAIYTVIHVLAAPIPHSGAYAAHFDLSMAKTLATYWAWSIGSVHLRNPLGLPRWLVSAEIVLVTALLLWAAWRDRLTAFFLSWFCSTLLPVLPLRDHVTEYYAFIPAIGLAMAGGWGLVRAWSCRFACRCLAVCACGFYLLVSLPQAYAMAEWLYWRSLRVKSLVLGVARARTLHPDRIIVLDGIDEHLFWSGVLNRPFELVGVRDVYLTPENANAIAPRPDWGDPREHALPEAVLARGLERGELAVYRLEGWRLRNMTTSYALDFRSRSPLWPRRVEPANPAMAYLLGPTWYAPEQYHRWMPRRAVVRMGAPTADSQKLFLRAGCAESQTRDGPLTISLSAQGIRLPSIRVPQGQTEFEAGVPLPRELVGRGSIEITIEVDKTARPPWDHRELGLTFGTLEIR